MPTQPSIETPRLALVPAVPADAAHAPRLQGGIMTDRTGFRRAIETQDLEALLAEVQPRLVAAMQAETPA